MSNSRNTNDYEHHRRRSSVTPLPLNSLLTRAKCTPGAPSSPFPIPTTTATNDQHRRMSLSTLGLSGTPPSHSPSQYFMGGRRVSVCSSNSEAIDENAIDDDDASRPMLSATFPRRMSLGAQAIRSARGGGNSGLSGGLNVSEQFKYRAESAVSQAYQNPLSSSPNFGQNTRKPHHRANSVSEMMPAPVNPTSASVPVGPVRRSPDAFQERILKGDFYMD
ncbi:hypothetical protein BGHDH14_bgh01655 [Blumeria hordei DH14]|uniref:Uncharacterized protein n=1 Tax=Blumeria graminis f. sp. hordei (strain DH14) TaxID=546991 RepID=N1J635_BLUG1|nr:hypothetical protein BGHDH14_bgh01655 [Blumeria hordei DH14]